jgi:hypothetical protein
LKDDDGRRAGGSNAGEEIAVGHGRESDKMGCFVIPK